MQNRNVPSFFFTSTTFEAHGLAAGSTISCFRISSTFLSIHSKCRKGWRRSGWRIGRLSPVSIWYSTKSVRPISWSPVEIIWRYFTNKLYAFCRCFFHYLFQRFCLRGCQVTYRLIFHSVQLSNLLNVMHFSELRFSRYYLTLFFSVKQSYLYICSPGRDHTSSIIHMRLTLYPVTFQYSITRVLFKLLYPFTF